MSSSDTFLESFLDGITTLPYEARRNLELIKELDKKFTHVLDTLRKAEDAYIKRTQGIILDFPIPLQEEDEAIVVPTTEELRAYVHDQESMDKIQSYRLEVKQLAAEKLAVANQTYNIINSTLGKLDREVTEYENLLRGTGEFNNSTTANIAPPAPATIKNERGNSGNKPGPSQGGSSGNRIKPNELCAIRVSPSQMADTEWILGRVSSYNTESGMYIVTDEDPEAIDKKKFTLPPAQVKPVGHGLEKLQKGDIVYAVYTETTSFYQATVTQPPRKISGSNAFIHVKFKDDSDEWGVTHEKVIILNHVFKLSNGK